VDVLHEHAAAVTVVFGSLGVKHLTSGVCFVAPCVRLRVGHVEGVNVIKVHILAWLLLGLV